MLDVKKSTFDSIFNKKKYAEEFFKYPAKVDSLPKLSFPNEYYTLCPFQDPIYTFIMRFFRAVAPSQ